MAQIPVLREADDGTGRQPIVQLKELEPDWQRYNSWRASLVESYAHWLKRWKKLRLDDASAPEQPQPEIVQVKIPFPRKLL